MMPLTPFFDVSDISPVPYTQKAHKNAPQKRGVIIVIKLSSRIVHNVKPCKEKILLLLACNTLCER